MSLLETLKAAVQSVDNLFTLSETAQRQVGDREKLDAIQLQRNRQLLDDFRRLCKEFKTCRVNVSKLEHYRREAERWQAQVEALTARLEEADRSSASLSEEMFPIIDRLREKAMAAEANMQNAVSRHDALLNDALRHEEELNQAIANFDQECMASGNRAARAELDARVRDINRYTEDTDDFELE